MARLSGKVAVVTGTSRGIGKATAELFASEGASVVCVARTMQEGDHRLEGSLFGTIEGIRAAGGEATPVQADVSREQDRESLVQQAVEAYGGIDVLVNNAAMTTFHPLAEFPLRRWRLGFEVNIHAPFHLAQLALPSMIERGGGAILNISSASAVGPGAGPYGDVVNDSAGTMYGATKAALERFTQGLAAELYGQGITVAALSPSMLVMTPGATFVEREIDPEQTEPIEYMARAALLLVSEPPQRVSGRVCYSQAILQEFGQLDGARGSGVDRPGTGYSQLTEPAPVG